MDIGIIWALFCLVAAIISLLVFIVRRNQPRAKEQRAEWRATHPTLPKNYDMGIALMWAGLICGVGVMGGRELPHFTAAPNIWSGIVVAFAIFILLTGVTIMLRFRVR
jgi:hypothetical protein